MAAITTSDGTVITPQMLEQWDDDADRGIYQGEAGKVVTHHRYGRPRLYDEPMSTVTLRVDDGMLQAAEELARQSKVSRATMLRELLALGIREKQRRTA